MHLHRLSSGKAMEDVAEVGERRSVADQRFDLDDAVGEQGDGGQECIAKGKAAQDRPVIAEEIIGADLDLGMVGGDAELQVLAASADR